MRKIIANKKMKGLPSKTPYLFAGTALNKNILKSTCLVPLVIILNLFNNTLKTDCLKDIRKVLAI